LYRGWERVDVSKIEYGDNEGYQGSLSERVFTQLQNDILNGKYQPGDSLVETRLSEDMGVSRTPVREAVRQLELEGLVQSLPNRGAVVTGITAKDIEDIYTIRMLIEGLAARWAAEKITPGELGELKEAIEFEEFYTIRNDAAHLTKYDSRFHDTIYKACNSKPLMHTLSTFHHYVLKARNASFSTPGRAQKVLEEHKAILQAIIEKNPDKAEKLTIEHIRNAILNLIRQKPEND
jgi:DNA-binding GntR family transcriptional regulator